MSESTRDDLTVAARDALKQSFNEIVVEKLPDVQIPIGPVETLTLTWEQRCRAHRKCTTEKGTRIALVLPRGTVLSDGVLLHNHLDKTIQVKAQAEEVLVVTPKDAMEMCVIAHHLGNWHRSLQLNDDGTIVVEFDSPLAKWLEQKKISCTKASLSYHPNLKGAAHD
ncbi:MAG: urease accessory protein UreE [Candidatus Obscuribacterales bacterium]|nr:urease accessory protein UreE [Candidatus Obscuribacterales bacterium]